MSTMTDIDIKIREVAGRIKELREIVKYTPEQMAQKTGISVEEYQKCENGQGDLNFAFIYRCALAFNVDVTDIIEGRSPTLRSYTLTRKDQGQKIDEAHGLTYYNLASSFKNRVSEPLYVISRYNEDAQTKPIELTTHEGQECDIVVDGHLKVQIGQHQEVLGPGDSIYYNSSTPHGMIAVDGKDCIFYAIVLNPTSSADEKEKIIGVPKKIETKAPVSKDDVKRVYSDFVESVEDENGTPVFLLKK
mgnify:CR=1 FL=1